MGDNRTLRKVAAFIERQVETIGNQQGFQKPGPELVSAAIRNALQETQDETETALLEALPHVRRQLHGKHEQDRLDADQWLQKWEPLIRGLRNQK